MPEKVLVIDDDEELANLLGLLLTKKGFETRIAYGGAEGIEKAASFLPSVIVQDMMLPDISGTDLLNRLKMSAPSSRIIVVTGQGGEEVAVEVMKEGASDYLKKPFESQKLFSTINEALNISTSELELEKLTREVVHQNKEFFALNAFSSALLTVRSHDEKYTPALEIIKNGMDGMAAVLKLSGMDGGKIYIAASGDMEADELKICGTSRNVGLISYVSEIKKPAVVKDFAEEKRFNVPDEIHRHGIKAALAVPLLVKGVLRGVLAVFYGQQRDYNSSDIKLVSSFANGLALSVDNDYLASVLADFQNQWQTVLEAVPDRMNIQDTDHTIVMANNASAIWAGLEVRELIGQKCSWVFCNMK
ncbi:MAG: GAF domain-containing protein, partial [Nitrospirota bacterium]